MKKCLLWLTLALGGCVHAPVIAPCVTQKQLQELEAQEPPKVKERLTGQADSDIRIIAGSNLKLRAWGYNLRDALRVCAK